MNTACDLYLDLLMKSLTDWLYDQFDDPVRIEGRDWPERAHTMIGLKRLANVRYCVEDVLMRNVPRDFIETGVWRGGATIFMRAILKVHEVTDRLVWVADSFAGLPPPDLARYPFDRGITLHQFPQLAITLERVQDNFRRYGLLDEQVRFLKGWFRDTLPNAPIERLAVLRLDGDLYESTIQAAREPLRQAVGRRVRDRRRLRQRSSVQAGRARLSSPTRNQRSDPTDRLGGEFTGGAHSWIKPTCVVPDPDAAGTCPYQANDIPRIPRPRNLTN